MIDFDLSRPEDTEYPSSYNAHISECHKDAVAGNKMKKSHDLEALSIIIETNFRMKGGATVCTKLRQSNPDLLAIAADLSSS